MKGRLIVFEGTDGSGKSTQFRLLCQALEQAGKPFEKLIFPQYQEPSSALIRMYLGGEFGPHPDDVNAYAASSFYAVDRYAAWKKKWETLYRAGGLVLSDRYTTSNAIHQGSKLPPEERLEFFRWLFDFEYGRLGLPEPDLVVWLDMPIERSVEMLRSRESATHTKGDIHEVDTAYLTKCYTAAAAAADQFSWRRIPCTDAAGAVRDMEAIRAEIWTAVESSGLIN